MRYLFALVLLSFSSCAHHKVKYETKVNSMVGQSAESLFTSWGPPSRQLDTPEGNRMYVYESVPETRSIASVSGGLAFGRAKTMYCTTSFIAGPDKLIKSVSFEGNRCK